MSNHNQKKCRNQNRHKACPSSQRPNEHVQAVRSCVKGKEIVLIGGKPNREAAKQVEQALGVRLNWIETRGNESYRDFKSDVEREKTFLVMILICRVRHGHGQVKGLCEKAQKHYVRLPRGYNPNQLAYEIRNQCGKVLGCAL